MVPTLKPILAPLDGISSFQHVNHTTQLGVRRCGGDAVSPTVNDKDAKQCLSQGSSLRNATHHSSPLGHWDIDPTLGVQPSRQSFIYWEVHLSQPHLSRLEARISCGTVSNTAQIPVGDVNPSSLIQTWCQTWFSLSEGLLTITNCLFCHVP